MTAMYSIQCKVCTGLRWLVLSLSAYSTMALAAYPEKPVRMVTPYPAGSSSDVSARQIAPKLGEFLGQPMFVENRGGASAIVGTEAVARSPADGYTIMYATAQTHAINKGLFEKLPYDPVTDFTAIGRIATLKFVLVSGPEVPAINAKELVAYIKANPGKVTYASSGNGTTAHLGGVYFAKVIGMPLTHVPYSSVAQAIADLASTRVHMMIYPYAPLRGAIQGGKLKLLASTGDTRMASLPDTPTMIESDFPGFVVTTWNGIYAPARVPRPIVDVLSSALGKTLKDPAFLKSLEAGGYVADPNTPDEFAAFTRSEAARYAEILRNAGVKVD